MGKRYEKYFEQKFDNDLSSRAPITGIDYTIS